MPVIDALCHCCSRAPSSVPVRYGAGNDGEERVTAMEVLPSGAGFLDHAGERLADGCENECAEALSKSEDI